MRTLKRLFLTLLIGGTIGTSVAATFGAGPPGPRRAATPSALVDLPL